MSKASRRSISSTAETRRKAATVKAKTRPEPHYGSVRSAEELGGLARAHRKRKEVTLSLLSNIGNLSPRFLSEFERGKKTAELGKVLEALGFLGLEVVVQPRRWGGAGARGARIAAGIEEEKPEFETGTAKETGGRHDSG